ncbi:TSUP family transporter [Williamsoniiplasma lucivorax]|uniref:Membrane transporter protein n=1 Tax=Williamsoniiplasma lucivorax TaxID=209274 RepID=A0A2S5RFP3_9MOLU|nr:TSUP family transporter [Williamsoniiplasma lucivorax]PPE06156.1 hypothetical protein ELUCI_v1c04470 [Williamsoniiplasma lucivorax]
MTKKIKAKQKSWHVKKGVQFEKAKEKDIKRAVYMVILTIAFAGCATALAINFLILYPHKNKGEAFIIKENWIAFALTMVMVTTAVVYSIVYFWTVSKIKFNDAEQKITKVGGIGFIAAFLDTIGVGSFAVTTGLLKGTRTLTDDSLLPGTLNVTFGVSALFEAGFLIGAIKIDPWTLIILVASVIAGTVTSSFFVAKLKNPRVIKLVVGSTLLIVGIVMILTHPDVNVVKTITEADGLHGFLGQGDEWRMIVSAISFFFLGCIMSFGVGLYAPSMAILTLLGMNAAAIFPIMASGASLCMIFGSIKFIKNKKYMEKTGSTMMMAAIFGAITSFLVFFVAIQVGGNVPEEQFMKILKWVAVVVVFYTSTLMLVEYIVGSKKAQALKQERLSKPKLNTQ